MDKIKRQKIDDRFINFSYEERLRIGNKSNNLCCHCGKEVYPGYGATVDHFIPLDKGGINRDINFIMLCEKCNKTKTNKIVDPEKYLKYLKPKYLEDIKGYFNSYISSFEYLDRNNLLCYSEYDFDFKYKYYPNKYNQKLFIIKDLNIQIKKLDKYDDSTELKKFYTSCLKKMDVYTSQEYVDLNIDFWLEFGCIYYVVYKDEIKSMFVLTIQQQFLPIRLRNDSVCGTLVMRIFNNHSNTTQNDIVWASFDKIIKSIFKDQKIRQLPINVRILLKDSCSKIVLDKIGCKLMKVGVTYQTCTIFESSDFDIVSNDYLKTSDFFNKFDQAYMDDWFIENNCEEMKWIGDDVIQYYDQELTEEEIEILKNKH